MAQTPDSNEKTYAIISHLTPLAGCIIPGVGFIFGPILWWVLMKDKSPAADLHGKEVLNFSISYFIYLCTAVLLIFVLIGIPLLILLSIAALVFIIIGTIKAAGGELYRYPLILRLLK